MIVMVVTEQHHRDRRQIVERHRRLPDSPRSEHVQRACALRSDDQDLKLRLDLISQTLSDYYVAQAKRYLDKPLGSGVGLAWLYLNEAQQYQSNRDDIRDERTKNSAIHNVRSTLSIKVVFRDQTSRRDSAGRECGRPRSRCG